MVFAPQPATISDVAKRLIHTRKALTATAATRGASLKMMQEMGIRIGSQYAWGAGRSIVDAWDENAIAMHLVAANVYFTGATG